MTTDLVAWLRQQLDADAAVIARNSGRKGIGDGGDFPDYRTYDGEDQDAADAYLERFVPPRMAAEVDTKRRILDLYEQTEFGDFARRTAIEDVLQLLALPYADRPGYREEWRP